MDTKCNLSEEGFLHHSYRLITRVLFIVSQFELCHTFCVWYTVLNAGEGVVDR